MTTPLNLPPPPLAAKARLAAWGLAVYAATLIAAALMTRNAVGAVACQAALAEWGSGRLLVTWSDPHAPMPSGTAIAKRALKGAGIALVLLAAVVALALAAKGVRLVASPPKLTSLAVGLLAPVCLAVRDELLLHGLVLRLLDRVAPPPVAIVACGLSSAAAAFGVVGATPFGIAAAGLGGIVLGFAWVRDRGAWLAWGAHAAWLWATTSLVRGGLVDLRAMGSANGTSPWGGGDAGVEASLAAIVVLGVAAVAAVVVAARDHARETAASEHIALHS